MKTLKADTLDLISAAAQQRLRNILEAVVKARDHRLRIHAARPPPNYPDVQDQPVWDIDVGEDVDKILAVMAKVDRDEEKTARRARIAKEEVELQEKQAAEAAARENEEDGQDGATTRKKQKETSARNLTEEQQAKMTNASTRQMLFGAGGSKYSWLSGPPSSSGNGTPNPLPLPSLPGGTLLGGNTGSSANTPTSSGNTNAGGMAASVLNPSRAPGDATDDEEASEAGKVIWQDLQFALMHERGTGVGQGTGQHSFTKASLLRGR